MKPTEQMWPQKLFSQPSGSPRPTTNCWAALGCHCWKSPMTAWLLGFHILKKWSTFLYFLLFETNEFLGEKKCLFHYHLNIFLASRHHSAGNIHAILAHCMKLVGNPCNVFRTAVVQEDLHLIVGFLTRLLSRIQAYWIWSLMKIIKQIPRGNYIISCMMQG